ncbi:12492_t:CDS:2 [Cetraspora pellucida]|uniref:12492_t:CDS:1 n=1 Tax=Cetraspora pellucida TaxID=1433469 RepID=A0ACA9LGZ3_9GLOM|nr:12492_t:CDS:2 [Cetraspora pellucida]
MPMGGQYQQQQPNFANDMPTGGQYQQQSKVVQQQQPNFANDMPMGGQYQQQSKVVQQQQVIHKQIIYAGNNQPQQPQIANGGQYQQTIQSQQKTVITNVNPSAYPPAYNNGIQSPQQQYNQMGNGGQMTGNFINGNQGMMMSQPNQMGYSNQPGKVNLGHTDAINVHFVEKIPIEQCYANGK